MIHSGLRGVRGIVAVVAMLTFLVGCFGDESVEVPEGLLSAKTVGATAADDIGQYLASAGGEASDGGLVRAATGDCYAGYRRGEEGQEEIVVIGASPASESLYQRDRRRLIGSLDDNPNPASDPGDEANRLPASHPGTVAFSSVWFNQYDERISILRSYTYLEDPNPMGQGVLVMVSIRATGEADPSPEELERLTTAQIKKTRATSAAPYSPQDQVPVAIER